LKCVPFSIDVVTINRCLNATVPFAEFVNLALLSASLSQVTAVNCGSHQQITYYMLPGAWLLVLSTWSLTELPRFINDEPRRKTDKRKTGEGVIYTAESVGLAHSRHYSV